MTGDGGSESFGPYAFKFTPEEAEAAAARWGLRSALKGGLLARHVAPLTIFALAMAFASTLALTGLISRRAGEATLILAAAAFMIQRLATHWRISRARNDGGASIAQLRSARAVTAEFSSKALSFDFDGATLRLGYAGCQQVEDAGGLIYVYLRDGPPIVVPTRVIADSAEAARLVAFVSGRIRDTKL